MSVMDSVTSRLMVKADDETQGRVVIQPRVLAQAEKLVNSVGLGESTMSKTAHHMIVGAVAYMISNNLQPLTLQQATQLVKKNRSALSVLAKSISRSDTQADDIESNPLAKPR